MCYACSVQCHGEHTLVEIFNKRNFTCDCGTTRFPATSPCSLRVNPLTKAKGGIHSDYPDPNNKYNHNFSNRFCGCDCYYDPFKQKGTMFQCLGLGTHETGGCGEDWWHPGCVVGLGPNWFEAMEKTKPAQGSIGEAPSAGTALPTISEGQEGQEAPGAAGPEEDSEEDPEEVADDDVPMPLGFPGEHDFYGFLCYKCVDAHPWIRRYAGTPGFLPAVFFRKEDDAAAATVSEAAAQTSRKRKAEDDEAESQASKRVKDVEAGAERATAAADTDAATPAAAAAAPDDPTPTCKLDSLPPAPAGQFSLFLTESFREQFCRCRACYPLLKPHAQLLEEEDTYEPPVSEDGGSENGGGSVHSGGSIYDRGENALRNVDRVRAIEGVMAYNHMKEKLQPFFRQFAESGKAISADDIKEYFAKLRGDEQAIKDAGEAAKSDSREEQSGY